MASNAAQLNVRSRVDRSQFRRSLVLFRQFGMELGEDVLLWLAVTIRSQRK
jgi:hypothetical protein